MRGPHEDHPIRDGRRRQAGIAQGIDRQQLEFRPGTDDADAVLLAREVELAVGCDRRGRVSSRPAKPFLVDLLAGLRLITGQDAAVEQV